MFFVLALGGIGNVRVSSIGDSFGMVTRIAFAPAIAGPSNVSGPPSPVQFPTGQAGDRRCSRRVRFLCSHSESILVCKSWCASSERGAASLLKKLRMAGEPCITKGIRKEAGNTADGRTNRRSHRTGSVSAVFRSLAEGLAAPSSGKGGTSVVSFFTGGHRKIPEMRKSPGC